MKKEREQESGELVWDFRIEERQQTTYIIHAGYLKDREKHGDTHTNSSSGAIGQQLVSTWSARGTLLVISNQQSDA